jgi:hypothetical protein
MSYEGYEQHICKNGHYFERDVSPNDMWGSDDAVCSFCAATSAWENSVDTTNGGEDGKIPFEVLEQKFLISRAENKVCPTCNHSEQVSKDVFRIPTNDETDPLKEYVGEIFDY